MFKIKSNGGIYTVVDVKIENFEWGYYNEKSTRIPNNTWFLICVQGCFIWVKSDECELYEGK